MEQNLFVVVIRMDVMILIYDSGRIVNIVVFSVIVANTSQATGFTGQEVEPFHVYE
jgi:hypothetical protein